MSKNYSTSFSEPLRDIIIDLKENKKILMIVPGDFDFELFKLLVPYQKFSNLTILTTEFFIRSVLDDEYDKFLFEKIGTNKRKS